MKFPDKARSSASPRHAIGEAAIQLPILLEHVRGRGVKFILPPIQQIAERGSGKQLGRAVQSRRDGGELLLLYGRQFAIGSSRPPLACRERLR